MLPLPLSQIAHSLRIAAISVLLISSSCAYASGPITVETAFGPVLRTEQPKRVITLGDNALDASLSLQVEPVGALASRGGNDIPDYLKTESGPLALVGTVRETNLEAVLKLKPDLILAAPGLAKEAYAKLSLIAPTVVPKGGVLDDWRSAFRSYASALGKEVVAEQRLAEIEQRVTALKSRLPSNLSASVVRWNPQGPLMMSSNLFAGQLLRQLGINANPLSNQLTARPHSDVLSLENLSKADADWIFLATLNPDGKKALEEARQQPAFARLNAVKNAHVASVDGQIWSSSSGYLAAQQVLNDIEKAIIR